MFNALTDIAAASSEQRPFAFPFDSFISTQTPTRAGAAPDAWTGESQRLNLYILSSLSTLKVLTFIFHALKLESFH